MTIKKIDFSVLESISKIFGETDSGFKGSEIGKLLDEVNIPDPYPSLTKWKGIK